MIQERLKELRAQMQERGIDIYIVPTSDFHQSEYVGEYFKARKYMTGFTGSAGTAVITKEEAGLWTDGRYFIQAEKQLEGSTVKLFKMGEEGVPKVEEYVKDHLTEGSCIGFDGRVMDAKSGEKYAKMAEEKKAALYVKEDLVGNIWKDRPELPANKVWILEDVYAPSKELTPVFGEESYESLLIRNYAKSRISDRIRISENSPRLLQICHCRGEVKVDEIAKTEQGIKMEGAIEISVLYITADDEHPFALVTGMIPFSHLMEAEGITSECRFHLHPQIEQLSASMSGEEVEIKGTLSLNLFAVRIMHQNCILDIEEKELDLKKLQERPGIVCYVVQPEDTLWDIAKKYYTTSEHIRNMNHLTEEIRAGQKLLIVKSAVLHTAS